MNYIAISVLRNKLKITNEQIHNYKDSEHFYYVKDILVNNKKELEEAIRILEGLND